MTRVLRESIIRRHRWFPFAEAAAREPTTALPISAGALSQHKINLSTSVGCLNVSNDRKIEWVRNSFVRRRYSLSSGLAGCSRVSRMSVSGEAWSRWLRSLEIRRRLCVRRWDRSCGAMASGDGFCGGWEALNRTVIQNEGHFVGLACAISLFYFRDFEFLQSRYRSEFRLLNTSKCK